VRASRRFEGIPDTERGRTCLRDWGDRASGYAQDRLGGTSVTLHFDDQADRRGSFGRLLAYVTVDGENFNYDLVADGYARVYDSTFSQSDHFYDAESAAQQAERNVWSCRSATPTPTSTDTNGTDLVVANVHADAAGNDHENLNDEYVVFENTGETAIDLNGWSVTDEADHTYNFPDQFTLDPGAQVRLHTGSGEDTDTDLYWGSERAVWNNGGDTVFVFDDTGTQVISYQYG
jgi:micrococcal nuclease